MVTTDEAHALLKAKALLDEVRTEGAQNERATVVALARDFAAQLRAEALRIPLGDAFRGGPFHGASRFNVEMATVAGVRGFADALERGDPIVPVASASACDCETWKARAFAAEARLMQIETTMQDAKTNWALSSEQMSAVVADAEARRAAPAATPGATHTMVKVRPVDCDGGWLILKESEALAMLRTDYDETEEWVVRWDGELTEAEIAALPEFDGW